MTEVKNLFPLGYAQYDRRYASYIPQNIGAHRVSSNLAAVDKKPKPTVHIGEVIAARIREKRMTPVEIYKKMKISKQSYYYYIDKPTIDTGMLIRFSEAVEHNFFLEYLNESEKGDKRAEMLQKELDATKAELNLTKEKLMAQYEIALKKRA